MKYTTSFRNSVLKKILPPSNRSVTSVSKETGVAVVTINNWLAKLKEGKMSLDEDDENPSSMRNSREKLDLLIEYQTVSEENQGEWLRQHGLHSEHLPLFRQELNELMAEKVDEKDKRSMMDLRLFSGTKLRTNLDTIERADSLLYARRYKTHSSSVIFQPFTPL